MAVWECFRQAPKAFHRYNSSYTKSKQYSWPKASCSLTIWLALRKRNRSNWCPDFRASFGVSLASSKHLAMSLLAPRQTVKNQNKNNVQQFKWMFNCKTMLACLDIWFCHVQKTNLLKDNNRNSLTILILSSVAERPWRTCPNAKVERKTNLLRVGIKVGPLAVPKRSRPSHRMLGLH